MPLGVRHPRTFSATFLMTAALGIAMLAGACTVDDPGPLAFEEPTAEATSTAPTTTQPTTTEPTTTTTTRPTTTTTTEPPPPAYPAEGLAAGDESDAVMRLQTELTALGFRPHGTEGPDGVYGDATTSAVLAFEKFEGLERDGVADPVMLAALGNPRGLVPMDDAPESRIEIDITRQIIFARDGSGDIKILNTSTGNGEPYKASNGKYYNANTPRGDYEIYRRINGVRKAFLGSLYRPLYFKRGWAIHGSNSVPAYPASHGCARVRNDDQDWLYETFENGTFVAVYD